MYGLGTTNGCGYKSLYACFSLLLLAVKVDACSKEKLLVETVYILGLLGRCKSDILSFLFRRKTDP